MIQMNNLIQKLIERKDLDENDIITITDAIDENDFEPVQMSGLLCALNSKGFTSDELYFFTKQLSEKAKTINLDNDCIDVCGTGGDVKGTFNVSTAVMIVLAASGIKIAKHGNKAVSSSSGSFDVLETLGLDLSKLNNHERIQKIFDSTDIALMFAPFHHPAFKNIGPIRMKLGLKTIFNIMGPLLNPANVDKQLIGVFDSKYCEIIAKVLQKRGSTGMVVNGNGLDEITIDGKTEISKVTKDKIESFVLDPKDYDMEYSDISEIQVSNSKESAKMIKDVFNAKKGPARNIVLLNTAAGLIVAEKAKDFTEGIDIAKQTIDSGKAIKTLNRLIDLG